MTTSDFYSIMPVVHPHSFPIEDAHCRVMALAEIGGKYAQVRQVVDDRARKILQKIVRELEY